jgi:monovalent cation:proton antiporter-2 (CPA2) family protein
MHGEGFFFQAFVYLAAAVISVPIASRLGLGSVLGYLIAGVAIGPIGLAVIGDEGQDVMHFAEFGVVMMLFLIGLELRPTLLWRLRAAILGLGGLQVALTAAAIATVGIVVGLPWQTALAIGLILALSSTAIVLKTLREKGLMQTDSGQSAFAVLLFQDLAVIPLLAILPLLAVTGDGAAHAPAHAAGAATEHATTWIEGFAGWAKPLVVLGAVAVVIAIGRFVVQPVFRFIAGTRLRELVTAAALLLIIGIALLMARVGLSPALGTFLAGVVLANSEYRHELESDIEPFKGLLLGLFFIAVGASIDFELIAAQPQRIGVLVATLILIKLVVLLVLGRAFRMSIDQNLIFTFALAQGGEFGFVLFSFATQNGVLPNTIASPLIAVVALSMAVTPLLMLLNEKLFQPRIGTREVAERSADTIEEENAVIIAGFGRFGNVVGRLLAANGIGTTVLDLDSDHVDLLRRLGLKVFYGDATRHDLLAAAGAEHARLVIIAIDEQEKVLRLVESVNKHYPHLTIMARARGRAQAYELLDAGVDHIYRETLDSSLRVGVDALGLLGVSAYEAHRQARMFRRHDEHAVRELAQMRHDRTAYISRAREQLRILEETLQADMERFPSTEESAWDSESLRREYGTAEPD